MTDTKLTLSDSQENYLETILLLTRQNEEVRSIDIADRMNVKRASVAGALQALKKKDLVNHERYGRVTLTPKGKIEANRVLKRHEALREFMINVLSIDHKEADAAACHMEHGISKYIVDRFVNFASFYANCPNSGATWSNGFGFHCQNAILQRDECAKCKNQTRKKKTSP